MATITKSIGTSSRDYSTITAWEADLDNTGIYTSGDDAVGECYNDSTFNETISIDGGGTVGLNNVDLTVANGQKHDGTEGTGARIVLTATATAVALVFYNDNIKVDWLEIDYNGNQSDSTGGIVIDQSTRGAHHLIMHGINNQTNISISAVNLNTTGVITNSILYDLTLAPGNWDRFIHGYAAYANSARVAEAFNCVAHGFTHTGTKNSIMGFRANNNAAKKFKNCISGDHVHSVGASSSIDFWVAGSAPHSAVLENNISEDDTATTTGTNSIANTSPSSVFVSVVSGSEDFHLSSTSPARGAGTDLVATPDGVQYDINGSNRNALAATVWDIGAHQYASTASIGTSARDYSTIALWEADLDDTTIYGAGANAVGECYNDSTFALTDHITLRGGGVVGLSSVTVTAAQADRHDGTADTGVKITFNAFKAFYAEAGKDASTRIPTIVEWLDIDGQGFSRTFLIAFYDNTLNSALRNCITRGPGDQVNAYLQSYNNIAYGSSGAFLTNANFGNRNVNQYNNTIHLPVAYRVTYIGTGTVNIKNILATSDNPHPTYGLFSGDYLSSANNASNISSDGTAIGTNSKTNQPVSRQFVSTLSGSEDLHLIFKSAAIDAGVDLGTTPDGVQYDINGKNRDAEGSIWDIGAHEYGDNVVFGLFKV